ncbi:MAG: hypothetical protein LIO67_04080 [Lachnospiraceae bacterium]|nr:hypothetical protein [Lachnospiraceae bacterium]
MPSKLPVIKANTSQENIEKMKVIARANKRSVAKELEWLIEKHIEDYERENGKIETVGTKPSDLTSDKSLNNIEKSKKAFEKGIELEQRLHDKKHGKSS